MVCILSSLRGGSTTSGLDGTANSGSMVYMGGGMVPAQAIH